MSATSKVPDPARRRSATSYRKATAPERAATATAMPVETASAGLGGALVDLNRFPIDDPNSPTCRRLIDDCRAQLRETGSAMLPGFVRPEAVARMAAEMQPLADRAYFCDGHHNAYLKAPDLDLPADHPRNRELETEVGSIAWDEIGPAMALRQLYLWDPLVAFVGAVLERESFYRFADPLGACSVNVFRPGMAHGWHFDEAEFSTSLMLQKAEKGGEFDAIPFLRPRRGEDFDAVGRVLDGDESRVRRLTFEPGTLSIFHGRRALHRVTRCAGARDRLVAILCFASEPRAVNSDAVRKLFWGRTK
jgi:hypothetical protein